MEISSLTLIFLLLRGILVLAMPFAVCWYLHKRYGTGIFPAFIGAVTVMLILVPRALVRKMFIQGIESDSSKWIAVWLIGAAFEECGRYIAMKHAIPNRDTVPDAICYGAGHGGTETVMTALMQFVLFAEAASGTGERLEAISQQGFLTAAEVVCGQASNLAFHIAMSVLIARAVHWENCKKLIPIAILVHAFCNFTDFCFGTIADVMLTAVICLLVWLHGRRAADYY
ncbi:MAG TPA: hypothetical protein DDX71_02620 [Ruminococcus sp.]|nr:hypothetical protein [Ruminococcus sp.]